MRGAKAFKGDLGKLNVDKDAQCDFLVRIWTTIRRRR